MGNVNPIIYMAFVLFLATAGFAVWRRFARLPVPYPLFLLQLAPSVFLLAAGVFGALRELPSNQLTILGYSARLDSQRSAVLGSDAASFRPVDFQFHHWAGGREQIAPRLLKIGVAKNGKIRLTQLDRKAGNVVTVDGRPLGSIELTAGVVHSITFAKYGYDDNKSLKLVVDEMGIPEFRYRGESYSTGFKREVLGGHYAFSMKGGAERHLSYARRLEILDFEGLFKQASLYWEDALGEPFCRFLWKKKRVWLAANDAEMRLDGKPFPEEIEKPAGCKVKIYSSQLEPLRRVFEFSVEPDGDKVFLSLDEDTQKRFALPEKHSKNICLIGGSSPFADAFNIYDPHFPPNGFIVKKEGGRFLFRGEALPIKTGDVLEWGNARFRFDSTDSRFAAAVFAFCLVFLLSVLFFPAASIRKEPVVGIILSTCVFLLAFRQVLAFRAWQGPPYNFGAFLDSAVSPYLFVLTVIMVSQFYPVWKFVFLWIASLLAPFFKYNAGGGFSVFAELKNLKNGLSILGVVLFGFAAFFVFRTHLRMEFILVIGLLLLSLFLNAFDRIDRKLFHSKDVPFARMIGLFAVLSLAIVLAAPLLGGREVVSILPGRPRPDIVLQLLLLFFIAYLVDFWESYKRDNVMGPKAYRMMLMSFAFPFAFCMIQGGLSRDLGFIVMVWPPLFFIIILAAKFIDPRIVRLTVVGLAAVVVFVFLLFDPRFTPVDNTAFNRILFLSRERLKAEYFFDYMRHLPVIWTAAQGICGAGFFNGLLDGGVRNTCVNDHVSSVFIQGELGAVGVVLTISVFFLFFTAVCILVGDKDLLDHDDSGAKFRMWVVFGIACMIFWTAFYMITANLGYVPLTGKNLPLLGLDSKNDVLRYGLLIGFAIRYIEQMREG